jgi:hypothetical protein
VWQSSWNNLRKFLFIWSHDFRFSMSLSLSPNSLYCQTTNCTEGGGLTREHYSLIQTRSLAKYVFRFHLLCIRFLLLPAVNTISIPYKFITKWKRTSKFSQLDRVYVPIRKKIDKCTNIYAIYIKVYKIIIYKDYWLNRAE